MKFYPCRKYYQRYGRQPWSDTYYVEHDPDENKIWKIVSEKREDNTAFFQRVVFRYFPEYIADSVRNGMWVEVETPKDDQ